MEKEAVEDNKNEYKKKIKFEESPNNIKSSQKKNGKKIKTYLEYPEYENSKLILSYGPQIYEYSRYCEGLNYGLADTEVKAINILKNHDITPQIRTKLVDWLFEVLYAYKCEENTMYMTFHLMDAYLYKQRNKMTNSDIHLVGVTALYIASKFEDLCPLDIYTIKTKISHNKFSEKDIKKKEKSMLELLEFKIINATTYDFIRNFVYDFKFNNRKILDKLKFKDEIAILEQTAIYISKIAIHNDIFSGLKSSIKAVACIAIAFDLVREKVRTFEGQAEGFTKQWLNFLIEQSRYDPDSVHEVYEKIKGYFVDFDKTPLIQHNLKKNFDLPFSD